MCNDLHHPHADRAGLGDHDHEEHAEAQLDAAFQSELGSVEQDVALQLASVEAQLATARELRRIADALENVMAIGSDRRRFIRVAHRPTR